MATSTQVLGQFFVVSLLVERIIAVGEKMLGPDGEPPPTPPSDPWASLTKVQVGIAFLLALIISYVYSMDLLEKLLGASPYKNSEYFGYLLTAIVIAGGSAGLQKIIAASSATAKAFKEEAYARYLHARVAVSAFSTAKAGSMSTQQDR